MFTEDLTAFFNTSDFALEGTLSSGGSANVIFDRAALEAFGVSSTAPQCLVRAADVSGVTVGTTTITISSVVYTIRDRQPLDDGAVVLLILQA